MKPFADGCIANLMDRLDAREDILEKQDDSVQEGDLSGRQLSTPRQSWRDVQTDVRDELVGRSNEAERVTSEVKTMFLPIDQLAMVWEMTERQRCLEDAQSVGRCPIRCQRWMDPRSFGCPTWNTFRTRW